MICCSPGQCQTYHICKTTITYTTVTTSSVAFRFSPSSFPPCCPIFLPRPSYFPFRPRQLSHHMPHPHLDWRELRHRHAHHFLCHRLASFSLSCLLSWFFSPLLILIHIVPFLFLDDAYTPLPGTHAPNAPCPCYTPVFVVGANLFLVPIASNAV